MKTNVLSQALYQLHCTVTDTWCGRNFRFVYSKVTCGDHTLVKHPTGILDSKGCISLANKGADYKINYFKSRFSYCIRVLPNMKKIKTGYCFDIISDPLAYDKNESVFQS